jgi:hypothetical protein
MKSEPFCLTNCFVDYSYLIIILSLALSIALSVLFFIFIGFMPTYQTNWDFLDPRNTNTKLFDID